MTILNTGQTLATGCSIAPTTIVSATFLYQTTDPATNMLTGTANTPIDIPANGAETFVIAFTPSATFITAIALRYTCANTDPAPVNSVNTFRVLAY